MTVQIGKQGAFAILIFVTAARCRDDPLLRVLWQWMHNTIFSGHGGTAQHIRATRASRDRRHIIYNKIVEIAG